MGIEPAHGNARVGDAQLLARIVAQVDRVEHFADGQRVAQLHQRLMHGGQHDLELGRIEHHRHALALGSALKHLRVAGELTPRQPPGLFGDRSGDQRIDAALAGWLLRGRDRVIEKPQARPAAFFAGAIG